MWSISKRDAWPPFTGGLFDAADPAMIVSIGRAGEVHVTDADQAAALEGVGQLHECICFDSHGCYLVRMTVYLNLDRALFSKIQYFFLKNSLAMED